MIIVNYIMFVTLLYVVLHIVVADTEDHISSISLSSTSCYEGTYKVASPPYGKCSGYRVCEIGKYCVNEKMHSCPAGYYGNAVGLSRAVLKVITVH